MIRLFPKFLQPLFSPYQLQTAIPKIELIGKTKYVKSDIKTHHKNIALALENICLNIENIQKGKLLGKGTEGAAYQYCVTPTDCRYVAKLQLETEADTFQTLFLEMEKTNEAADAGLAPKIYAVIKCDNVIITLMDLVKGVTLAKYFETASLTVGDVDKFIEDVDKLHTLKVFTINMYHGDFNPQNIFYDTKNFIFIDFGIKGKGYKKIYDYGTMFYYLIFQYEISRKNYKVIMYIIDKFIEKLTSSSEKDYEGIQHLSAAYKIYKSYKQTKTVSYVKTYLKQLQEISLKYFYEPFFL